MTLQQQAINTIESLPEEKLPMLIQFAHFLVSDDSYETVLEVEEKESINEKRKRMFGVLKGKIKMADDFNETPKCFREYI